MCVVDADGESLGTVVHVTTGDSPDRAGAGPDQSPGWAERAFAEPASRSGVRQAERLHLLRLRSRRPGRSGHEESVALFPDSSR